MRQPMNDLPSKLDMSQGTGAPPPAIRATALLFLALGGLGVLHTYSMVTHGAFLPSPALLGFPISFGLLRLSNIARYIAIAVLGYICVLYLPALMWVSFRTGTRPIMLVSVVVIWLINLWQLRTLFRPEVRAAFHPNG